MKLHAPTESTVIIELLEDIGWQLSGDRYMPAGDKTGRQHARCLAIEGNLFSVPRMAFCCIDTHLVMMIGEMTDYTLTEFCELVKHGEPPAAAVTVPVLRSVPQRSLF